MPHLRIEYSANLEGRADIGGLCAALHQAIAETGLFEAGAPRVRAFAAAHYAIADRDPQNAFVDLEFRVGQGRQPEDLRRAGDRIFAAASVVLKPVLDAPHFALSLEIRTIDSGLSWKRNTMHARLR